MLKSLLAHPLTRGLAVDDPETTALRWRIIREKTFLKRVYQEWYASVAAALPDVPEGPVLELGAGGGFLKEFVPDLIASEVFHVPHVDVIMDGQCMPFLTATLKGIVMTDVLHHLPQPRAFFAESARCVRPGGVIVAIEPWVTPWSRLVYGRLHHEPFQPDAREWEFPGSGPLSGANGALPWIIFRRDRAQFEGEFATWRVKEIRPCMPFRYLVSGGVSLRSLTPGWTFGFWRGLEGLLSPLRNSLGMFALIVLERTSVEVGE
ncbi:MAG: Methyltransferase type 11 [Dehalococcoidia bacterium]|nr:Methyltransferase type 11 [Dehalococcoidia bacterium]